MSEVEFDRLLDAVRMAIDPRRRKTFWPARRPSTSRRKPPPTTTSWLGRLFRFPKAGTPPADRAASGFFDSSDNQHKSLIILMETTTANTRLNCRGPVFLNPSLPLLIKLVHLMLKATVVMPDGTRVAVQEGTPLKVTCASRMMLLAAFPTSGNLLNPVRPQCRTPDKRSLDQGRETTCTLPGPDAE
jgi:hypothetical protein